MTTYFNFQPSAGTNFQFQPTLDGQQYTVIITWNVFGQRYYVNCYALSGALIFARALTGSPVGLDLETLSWSGGRVVATTTVPHGYVVGGTYELTVDGCVPSALNGTFRSIVTGPTTFEYSLANDPGTTTTAGIVEYNLNLAAGYFASSLVYREANGQFEVSP